MAHIHRISGSTKYLLNGVRPFNGKKPATFAEIHHLHHHHEKILDEIRTTIAREHDELIDHLADDEVRLDLKIKTNIARRTQEVEEQIEDLFKKTEECESVLRQFSFLIQYLVACSLRSVNIHSPVIGSFWRLKTIQREKNRTIARKSSIISQECNNVDQSVRFLKNNESFLTGAEGEEHVIAILSQLSSDFHVINDVNLFFPKAIHWREKNEYIRNCQIDHVVVGPTGIFLIETKNWKESDIEMKSDKLAHQVNRANLSLWYYLKDYYRSPIITNVVVSIQGSPSGMKPGKHIDIVAPYQLCNYIISRKDNLPVKTINRLIELLDVSIARA